ncbi:hypothetical protein [Sphingobacterium sp. WOUb80]|uniref:hypothetical protein n=1 Tax=Sphingobacterium sp. WOUb80 TaxID=3234028 RepID=UPI003CF1640F
MRKLTLERDGWIFLKVSATIAAFYILISILILPGGKFIYTYYPPQTPIKVAKDNGSFIKEISPSSINIIDTISYDTLKNALSIYLCKDLSYRRYGFFQFIRRTVENPNFVCLNIVRSNIDILFVQYDNLLPIMAIGDSNADFKFYKVGSDATVKIFGRNRKEIVNMNFSNLGN